MQIALLGNSGERPVEPAQGVWLAAQQRGATRMVTKLLLLLFLMDFCNFHESARFRGYLSVLYRSQLKLEQPICLSSFKHEHALLALVS